MLGPLLFLAALVLVGIFYNEGVVIIVLLKSICPSTFSANCDMIIEWSTLHYLSCFLASGIRYNPYNGIASIFDVATYIN